MYSWLFMLTFRPWCPLNWHWNLTKSKLDKSITRIQHGKVIEPDTFLQSTLNFVVWREMSKLHVSRILRRKIICRGSNWNELFYHCVLSVQTERSSQSVKCRVIYPKYPCPTPLKTTPVQSRLSKTRIFSVSTICTYICPTYLIGVWNILFFRDKIRGKIETVGKMDDKHSSPGRFVLHVFCFVRKGSKVYNQRTDF